MTAANNNMAGIGFAGCDPMIPVPGPNTSPNNTGTPNVHNCFICGGNEQNLGTIRMASVDSGAVIGAASGTHSAQAQPVQGSSKYFSGGMPVTRLGDSSTTNNNNMVCTQVAPSQTKCFVNA
ncbi:TPA: PAAR-like domain-containing protein [Serratia marcescens]